MTIKFNPTRRTVRETSADFEHYNDDGELVTSKLSIRYYSPTVADLKAQQDELKRASDQNEVTWLSNLLINQIESLPGLVGEDGKELPVTLELLESFPLTNLQAIQDAIAKDLDPKSRPAK